MKWLPLVVLVGAACSAAPVDFGSLSFSGLYSARGFMFFGGSGFSVYAPSNGGFLVGGEWEPGTTVFPDLDISELRPGSAAIGDLAYPFVIWSSPSSRGKTLLEAKATPLQLTGPGTFYGTFQFTGDLCGYTSAPVSGECDIVLSSLTGIGVYSLSVHQSDLGNGLVLLSVDTGNYSFGIPEPATFWLLGSGLAVLIAGGSRHARHLLRPV